MRSAYIEVWVKFKMKKGEILGTYRIIVKAKRDLDENEARNAVDELTYAYLDAVEEFRLSIRVRGLEMDVVVEEE